MSATLWDSFEHLLQEAEQNFLKFRYDEAMQAWNKYFEITAKNEFRNTSAEVASYLQRYFTQEPAGPSDLYRIFQALSEDHEAKKIKQFSFELFKKLIVQFYRQFKESGELLQPTTECGVLDYLSGDTARAGEILQRILKNDPENIVARTYLGFTRLAEHDQKGAITLLSENLFLAADQLKTEELYLSQFKLLYGKLYSDTGNREESAWQLTFESWYRSYLIITEHPVLYRLMQQKERNERIIQVKYYKYERYRHFVRCLYLAEYVRLHAKDRREQLREQESYMRKLDRELFARYRKKRKEL